MEKNSEYWEKRLASETWKTYNSLEEKNRELLEFYIDASESVKDELYRLAEKYSKDGVLSLSDMHKQNRLTELNGKFEKIIEDLGHSTEAFAKKNMRHRLRKYSEVDMEISIKNYIETEIPKLLGKLYPVFTTVLDDVSVVYTFTPISGGHVKQSQLELKIMHRDYDTCKDTEVKLKDLLDMEEDDPYITTGNIRFHSGIAGGGTIFNDGCQMFEDTLYFIVDWRKRNEKQ